MYKVYISGALTGKENLAEIKAFYESLGLLCEELRFSAYIPHLTTDPVSNPDITPRSVFETDKHQVSQSNLVIAYIGSPSLGVGMELAYAETNAIPVVLLYEKGSCVSRFPRGIPTVVAEIQFQDYADALIQLRNVLNQLNLFMS